jgi:hypothetical protein
MRRVFLKIVPPVLLVLEVADKAMREAALSPQQCQLKRM